MPDGRIKRDTLKSTLKYKDEHGNKNAPGKITGGRPIAISIIRRGSHVARSCKDGTETQPENEGRGRESRGKDRRSQNYQKPSEVHAFELWRCLQALDNAQDGHLEIFISGQFAMAYQIVCTVSELA